MAETWVGYPKIKTMPNVGGKTPKEYIANWLDFALEQDGAQITEHYEEVNGVQWIHQITVSFHAPKETENV